MPKTWSYGCEVSNFIRHPPAGLREAAQRLGCPVHRAASEDRGTPAALAAWVPVVWFPRTSEDAPSAPPAFTEIATERRKALYEIGHRQAVILVTALECRLQIVPGI